MRRESEDAAPLSCGSEVQSSTYSRRKVSFKIPLCRRLAHIYLSTLYLVQTALSYLLMLAVMSFNVWIMIAVVAGATIGSRIFDAVGHSASYRHAEAGNGSARESSSIEAASYGAVENNGPVIVGEGGVLVCRFDSSAGGARLPRVPPDPFGTTGWSVYSRTTFCCMAIIGPYSKALKKQSKI